MEKNNSEKILETILQKTHSAGNDQMSLKEMEIMQRNSHHEESQVVREGQMLAMIKLGDRMGEMIKVMGSVEVLLKKMQPMRAIKTFGIKTKEKKKLVLTNEVAKALKDIKPRIQNYNLLLNYLKHGRLTKN